MLIHVDVDCNHLYYNSSLPPSLPLFQMIKHAWSGYSKYAMGENEVKPVSKKGHSAVVFGKTKLGATLVDGLDTLYIAGLHDEFNEAKDWVRDHWKISEVWEEMEESPCVWERKRERGKEGEGERGEREGEREGGVREN